MRKLQLLLIACLLFLPAFIFAQTAGVAGKLVDTADNKSLENSVIAILKTDTTLINFTRATADGSFELKTPIDSNGTYILMVTHPSFADFIDNITLKKDEIVNLGLINMLSKAMLLEEIIVRGNRSMFMKGDTTVFTADSFKVTEGANVEELLRKLPGLQVDKSGKITAMGESVKKVLVDGEEFFGSDPGIATKNLRADVVQEVQVYDRKSDQATFTGIDDGTRDKTINLKLKEDKKKGYFGKIDAGGGTMDKNDGNSARYYGAAMLNAFKAKRKIAAYGITSNTGFMNLDWEDSDKFGGGNNMEMMDGGGFFISNGDWNSSNGIPVNYNAGLHYSNKFNQDKNSLNAGYKFVRIDAPGNTRIYSKNFTPDSSWNTNSTNNFVNSSQKHSLNVIYETKLDSMNTLKLTMDGNMNFSNNRTDYYTENINDKTGDFINKNTRNSKGTSDQKAYNANLLWMHKFKKEFRTVSVNTSFNNSESKNNSFLYSKIDFYRNGTVDSTLINDQQNSINNNNSNITTRVAYTEPLAKDFYMETSYAFGYNKRNNNRDIMGKGTGGNYDQRIDSLSNDYEFNDISNSPGLSFRYQRKKINASLGATVGLTNYKQLNKTTGLENGFNFTNHFPRANFNYQIKPSENLRFFYNGSTAAPSLEQMQPIRVNTDPLNQYIGNPNLRPSFSHRFNLNYSSWKMLNQRSIYIGLNGGFTQNAFTTLNYIRNAVRTTQTVNANGVYNFNMYAGYNRMLIKSINLRTGFSPNFNYNNRVDFIAGTNGQPLKNNTSNTSYGFNISLSMDKEKKYDIYMSPNFNYNIANASVNTAANAKYWSTGGNLWSTIYFPKEIELQNNVYAEFRQKDPRFPTNNNFTFWDAELRKWMFKRKLQAKFVVKDILNQRNGYNRNFNSSSFTETYNNVLRRHFLIGLVWNFNKMNTGGNEGPIK